MNHQPPHNSMVEGLLIGCLLFYPDLLKTLSIKEEYFYTGKFNTAYKVLSKMNLQQEVITPATFSARLNNENVKYSSLIGNWIYQSEITPFSAHTHLKILAEEYAKRVIFNSYKDLDKAPKKFIEKVKSVEIEFIEQKTPSLSESIKSYKEKWNEKIKRKQNDGTIGIVTGFDFIDTKVGIERGHLVVLAALTSVGKSALALNIALNAARFDFNVLFFSVEMTTEGLLDRIFASITKTDSTKFKYASAEEELEEAIKEITPVLENLKIINFAGGTSDDVCRITEKENQKKKVDLIVIDYLQILNDETEKGQTTAGKVGNMARKFKKLAGEADLACITLSQFNREASRMEDMPKLHQLRESGEIENHSDVILILHRKTRADTTAQIRAAKVRNGIAGIEATLKYSPETTTFYNMNTTVDKTIKGWWDDNT